MGRLLGSVIALTALLITPGVSFYFDITPKIVVLLAGTALVLVGAAVAGTRIAGKPQGFVIFSMLVLLNVISLLLSTVFSARPELSIFGTNWRRSGSVIQATVCVFAWLLALECAGNAQRIRTVLRAVAFAGGLSAAYGICQYFGWDPLLPAASYHAGEGNWAIVRPPGTLGHADYFATWLVFAVFLSLALRARETSPGWQRFALCTAVLSGCAIVLSGTRAALLGLVAGAIMWNLVARFRVSRRWVAGAFVTAAALTTFCLIPAGQSLRARVRWSSTKDPWGGARLALWRDSFAMALHRPASGYGPEVFTGEFPRFESVRLAREFPDFAHESPHNIFLDAFVAQGLPGALLLAALCVAAVYRAIRMKQALFAGALAAGIVALQFTAFTAPTAMIFWVTLGLITALDTPAAPPKRRIPLVASAVVVAAILFYVAGRLAIADQALALTNQRLDQADLSGASEEYNRYEHVRLQGGTADVWYSRALLALAARSTQPRVRTAAVTESAAVAMLATHTAEDPFNAWYNLAIVCGTQENAACTEHSLRAAIAAHPTWFKPHWTLAQVLFVQGRAEAALREATKAAELDGNKHREVGGALEGIRAHLSRAQSPMLQE